MRVHQPDQMQYLDVGGCSLDEGAVAVKVIYLTWLAINDSNP
jgi:hypothetical protein